MTYYAVLWLMAGGWQYVGRRYQSKDDLPAYIEANYRIGKPLMIIKCQAKG